MKNTQINMESFVNSYLHTASWVTCDSGENTDFTKEAIETAKNDCNDFIQKVIAEFGEAEAIRLLTIPGNDLEYIAPHDFFLTRNRHGAGFWDQENVYGQDAAIRLTEICDKTKEANCYHVRGKKSKLTFD